MIFDGSILNFIFRFMAMKARTSSKTGIFRTQILELWPFVVSPERCPLKNLSNFGQINFKLGMSVYYHKSSDKLESGNFLNANTGVMAICCFTEAMSAQLLE